VTALSHYHYRSMVSPGDKRKFTIASIIFHFTLAAVLFFGSRWIPYGPAVGLRAGGMGGGPAIGVGLVADLPAGMDYFKPPVKTPEPVAPEVPAVAQPAPPAKDDFLPKEDKKTPAKPEPKAVPKAEAKPAQPPPADKSATVATGDKSYGIVGGKGTGGVGEGSGQGVSIGSGSGDFYDSWYARQVEQRVSGNWLKSRMGAQFSGRHRAVVQFSVTPDGQIVEITTLENNGPEAFLRSALRAVHASDPLPPLPIKYKMQGNKVRFVAIFEYPTP